MFTYFCYDNCVQLPVNRGLRRESFFQKYTVNFIILTMFLIQGTFVFLVALPFRPYIGNIINIISFILFISSIGYFLATACTDPGIIPMSPEDEAIACIPQFEEKNPIMNKILEIKGQTFGIRYCPTCYMYRPPRVSHCSACNVCVENFDHHCPYLGNCIGRRNYRIFFYFLVTLTLYNCFLLASSFSMFLINFDRGEKSHIVLTGIMTIFLTIGLYPLSGLTGYHFFLIMAAMTTNEDIKDSFLIDKEGGFELVENPYSEGSPCLNLWYALCAPMPPTNLKNKK